MSSNSRTLNLSIPGMTCAGCVAKVEKALTNVSGVIDARVNLADKTATVDGFPVQNALLAALETVGKPGRLINNEQENRRQQEAVDQKQYQYYLKHSALALLLSIPLMLYMLVGSMSINSVADQMIWGSVGLLTAGILFFSGGHFFKGMWEALKHGSTSMDTLIALGTGTAWLYSMVVVLFPDIFPEAARHVYFEASGMIIGLINLGHALELRAKGKTGEAIKRLLNLQVKTARVVREENEIDIPVESVLVGDIIRVRPGERIPVDGTVLEGSTLVDESMLTGEPMPVHKSAGESVSTGTHNKNGSILFQAEKVGKDTALAHIIEMVRQAQNSKMPIARLADKISSVFVPIVIAIAILAGGIWFLLGPEPQIVHTFVVVTTVLIIACPCALGLATPMSVMVGVGKAAEFGVLVRNGEALQKASTLTTVVLDKTGTITAGAPEVTEVVTRDFLDSESENELLVLAASLESVSEHPLAEAIVEAAKERGLTITSPEAFIALTGLGVSGRVEGHRVLLGNAKLMSEHDVAVDSYQNKADDLAAQGKTPVYISVEGKVAGLIVVEDPIRADSATAIQRLHQLGINVVMLTGDNVRTAESVARQVGIDQFYAEVLPADKEARIRELQAAGEKVGMTGDGINDAPALARSDVGFAIGTGTDVAIESSDITLMRSSLNGLADAVQLSRATMGNIHQNLFGAFIYNSLGIPVAAGILFPFSGILLNPVIAGAAMALSSVTVVSNANRLRLFKPH